MYSLFHRSCPVKSPAVEAAFTAHLVAQARAGQAADAVTRSSDDARARLELTRAEIAKSTERDKKGRPQPHTSDVRALVEDVLRRPALRGLPHNGEKS